jgi:hypothetical protein
LLRRHRTSSSAARRGRVRLRQRCRVPLCRQRAPAIGRPSVVGIVGGRVHGHRDRRHRGSGPQHNKTGLRRRPPSPTSLAWDWAQQWPGFWSSTRLSRCVYRLSFIWCWS